MRRVLATTLLVLFSFSLIGPGIFASSESQLPECCRRFGMHHCAMMGASSEDASTAPALKSVSKCPYFPAGWTVTANQYPLFLGAARTVLTSIESHASRPPQIEARYRVSFSRSRQKRGPPSLYL